MNISQKLAEIFSAILLVVSLGFSVLANADATKLALPEVPDASKMSAPTADKLGTLEDNFGLKVGEAMPSFTLVNHLGKATTSGELLAQGKTLLVIFYRGGWCPYCNLQIRQLTESYSEFEQRKVLPVLISSDAVDGAALAQSRYEIPFPVLSDPDLVSLKAFRVVMSLSPELYQTYKGYGIDVEQWSGRDHHQFAVASAFLIDSQGKVVWAHASLDYKQRPSVAQLLGVVDSLK